MCQHFWKTHRYNIMVTCESAGHDVFQHTRHTGREIRGQHERYQLCALILFSLSTSAAWQICKPWWHHKDYSLPPIEGGLEEAHKEAQDVDFRDCNVRNVIGSILCYERMWTDLLSFNQRLGFYYLWQLCILRCPPVLVLPILFF